MHTEMKSWGECIVLEDTVQHKISKVLLYPRENISSQSPENGYTWILISEGVGCITSEGVVNICEGKDSVIIPKGIQYAIKNPLDEPFVYIEVQQKTDLRRMLSQ